MCNTLASHTRYTHRVEADGFISTSEIGDRLCKEIHNQLTKENNKQKCNEDTNNFVAARARRGGIAIVRENIRIKEHNEQRGQLDGVWRLHRKLKALYTIVEVDDMKKNSQRGDQRLRLSVNLYQWG